VPFYPQERYQCGPAALATLLDASGVPVDLDALVEQVYLPARQGSLQAELKAGARRAGRLPLEIAPLPDALAAELAAGRPVLVLQNLGVGWLPRWHYAVVVGLDPAERTVVLRSGTERRRVTPVRVFLNTWARSGYWGFVALRPGELPARADRERFFDAVAAAEEAGQPALAAAGWGAALGRWPDADVALFGLGNSLHALEDFAGAERAFRRLLDRRPRLAAVRNNLAVTLLELGRLEDAEEQARIALDDSDDEALATAIRATLEEIGAARASIDRG